MREGRDMARRGKVSEREGRGFEDRRRKRKKPRYREEVGYFKKERVA